MSHLFENDVDVTGNELGDLFPFSGLYRVVALLVLPKVLHTHTHTHTLYMHFIVDCKESNHCRVRCAG